MNVDQIRKIYKVIGYTEAFTHVIDLLESENVLTVEILLKLVDLKKLYESENSNESL